MYDRFTDRAIEVLAAARLEANARHHANMRAEHVLLALARATTARAGSCLGRLCKKMSLPSANSYQSMMETPPFLSLSAICTAMPF